MGEKLYNSKDAKQKEIIEILSKLPEVKTPDNFEFNLMARIKNGSFEIRSDQPIGINLRWVYLPAGAMVSAVVLFFVFVYQPQEFENLLMQKPTMRSEVSVNKADTMVLAQPGEETEILADSKKSNDDVAIESNVMNESIGEYKVVVQPNDVVKKEKIDFLFNNQKNIALDYYLNGNENNSPKNKRGKLVSAGDPAFDFNGFYVRNERDQEVMKRLKAQMDSLKKLNQQK